jgi:hypothetical protein
MDIEYMENTYKIQNCYRVEVPANFLAKILLLYLNYRVEKTPWNFRS